MRSVLAPLFAASLALAASPALAADDAAAREEVAVTRAEVQADRKAIVARALPLNDAEAKAFWPLYDSYRADMAKIGDETQEIILDYARDWRADSFTNERASALLDRWLKLRHDEADVQARWAKKLQAALPGTVVARFLQIENRLDLIVRAELASGIPLVSRAR